MIGIKTLNPHVHGHQNNANINQTNIISPMINQFLANINYFDIISGNLINLISIPVILVYIISPTHIDD